MKKGNVIQDGPWAGSEVISTYTREQAIEDGVLIDITGIAKKAGIEIPTAITATAFRKYLDFVFGGFSEEEKDKETERFLFILLKMCSGSLLTPENAASNTVFFEVGDLELKAVCHQGDNGEQVLTVMFQNED